MQLQTGISLLHAKDIADLCPRSIDGIEDSFSGEPDSLTTGAAVVGAYWRPLTSKVRMGRRGVAAS